MPERIASKPVEDSISKLNGEIAVGEDLEFQRKWWKFEHAVWIFFALLLLTDIAGGFGRGPLAKYELQAPDHSFILQYDRIQRIGTPSILTVNFSPSAIHNGEIIFYVGDSLVKELGTQRVVPSPKNTTIGNKGLTYTFPASAVPASVSFALEPNKIGLHHLTLQSAGSQPVKISIFVFP